MPTKSDQVSVEIKMKVTILHPVKVTTSMTVNGDISAVTVKVIVEKDK
jgi:hypothetical protein